MNFVDIALQALDIASNLMRDTEHIQIAVQKGGRDYATNVDITIEKGVSDFLRRTTPDIPIIGEELSPSVPSFDKAWVLDPIDGTINYSRSHPLYGISLALVSADTPIVAAIRIPELGRSYIAELGSGATLNGKSITVSSNSSLHSSIISFGDFAVGNDNEQKNKHRLRTLSNLVPHILRLRMHGAATVDMCLVADGTSDAAVTLSNKSWDMQAGVLVVREAGGVVVDHLGNRHTIRSATTIAATAGIVNELLPLLSYELND